MDARGVRHRRIWGPRRVLASSACLLAYAGLSSAGHSQAPGRSPADAALARLGLQAVRGVDSDICLPSDAVEYEGMGKNAILRLEVSSAISTELPLRAAYVTTRGVRVPLQRLAVLPKRTSGERSLQVTFYLLPIHLMKAPGRLLADFTGARTGFGVSTFPSASAARSMPAFARLDEYDEPTDPDTAVIDRVIAREYPDDFPQGR